MKPYKAPILAALGLTLYMVQPALTQIAKTAVGAVDATIDGAPYAGETLDVPS